MFSSHEPSEKCPCYFFLFLFLFTASSTFLFCFVFTASNLEKILLWKQKTQVCGFSAHWCHHAPGYCCGGRGLAREGSGLVPLQQLLVPPVTWSCTSLLLSCNWKMTCNIHTSWTLCCSQNQIKPVITSTLFSITCLPQYIKMFYRSQSSVFPLASISTGP